MNRFGNRRWYDPIDENVILGALPLRTTARELIDKVNLDRIVAHCLGSSSSLTCQPFANLCCAGQLGTAVRLNKPRVCISSKWRHQSELISQRPMRAHRNMPVVIRSVRSCRRNSDSIANGAGIFSGRCHCRGVAERGLRAALPDARRGRMGSAGRGQRPVRRHRRLRGATTARPRRRRRLHPPPRRPGRSVSSLLDSIGFEWVFLSITVKFTERNALLGSSWFRLPQLRINNLVCKGWSLFFFAVKLGFPRFQRVLLDFSWALRGC